MYQMDRILNSIMQNNNFPLYPKQRREILINFKKSQARKAIIALFMLKLLKFVTIIRITKPGISGFFFAFLPSKLRKFIIT
jgi:hypothetical protein